MTAHIGLWIVSKAYCSLLLFSTSFQRQYLCSTSTQTPPYQNQHLIDCCPSWVLLGAVNLKPFLLGFPFWCRRLCIILGGHSWRGLRWIYHILRCHMADIGWRQCIRAQRCCWYLVSLWFWSFCINAQSGFVWYCSLPLASLGFFPPWWCSWSWCLFCNNFETTAVL